MGTCRCCVRIFLQIFVISPHVARNCSRSAQGTLTRIFSISEVVKARNVCVRLLPSMLRVADCVGDCVRLAIPRAATTTLQCVEGKKSLRPRPSSLRVFTLTACIKIVEDRQATRKSKFRAARAPESVCTRESHHHAQPLKPTRKEKPKQEKKNQSYETPDN